jgi:gp6-like head-tail connector protein
MTTWPNLAEVRRLLRLQVDATEDAVIQTALAAAVDFGMRRLGGSLVLQPDGVTYLWVYTYPPDSTTVPDAAHEASLLHAARLYRRRDSIDGTIQWGDLTGIRVGRFDPDVLNMYDAIGPWGFA